MTDQLFSEATPAAPAALTPPRRRSSGALLLILAVVILLGAAGVAWVAWKGLVPMPEPVAGNLTGAPAATVSPATGAPPAGA